MRGTDTNPACAGCDLAGSKAAWLVWYLPGAMVVAGVFWDGARDFLWIPAFVAMGSACIANAMRCGRLHCYLTGPLFMLGAVATALSALGAAGIDWQWVLGILAAGTALGFGLEWVRGKYVTQAAPLGKPAR